MTLYAKKGFKQNFYKSSPTHAFKNFNTAPPVSVMQVRKFSFKKLMSISFLLICIGSITYLVFTAFKFSKIPTDINDIPLIQANLTAVKTIPTDPGGIQVLNQDKLIYMNLRDPAFKSKKSFFSNEESIQDSSESLRVPKEIKKNNTIKSNTNKNDSALVTKQIVKKNKQVQPQSFKSSKENKASKNPFELLEGT